MEKVSWVIKSPSLLLQAIFHMLLFLNFPDEEKILELQSVRTSTFPTGIFYLILLLSEAETCLKLHPFTYSILPLE